MDFTKPGPGVRPRVRNAIEELQSASFGPTGLGEIFYVDATSGASGNTGKTPNEAIDTIQGAVDLCGDGRGDIIIVGPGKYQENVMIVDHEAISILALFPGWATRVRASDGATKYPFTPVGGTATQGVCFAVCSRSVTIDGFCCDGGGGYTGVYVGDGYRIDTGNNENSASARIRNCHLRGGNEGQYGIVLDGCSDDVLVEYNRIQRNTKGGIYISSGGTRTVQRPIISNNWFVENKEYGIYMYSHGTTVGVVVGPGNIFIDQTGATMTNSVLFQGAGAHIMAGNFDPSAAGASGSGTDFMSGNWEAWAASTPKYVKEE